MLSNETLLVIHAGCCFAMAGLIWIIQLVHYPSFAFVERNRFTEFHRFHTRRISAVVIPLMLGELLTGFWLVLREPEQFLLPSALLLIAWGSTFLLQVPCHAKLEHGFDDRTHRKLLRTNWIRTAAWSIRCVLIVVLLALQV